MKLLPDPPREMLRRFDISALRPGQHSAYAALANGRDVLVILPTGGGKSLCYQLPAACGAAPAVVVSPLVALMKDQVDALQRRGISAAQLSGAVGPADRDRAWAMLEAGELALLYLAPEALASPSTLTRLARAAPRLLAIDEAHCISEWGESFRPAYLGLGHVRRALAFPPTIALTATATPRTAREIVVRLALRDPVLVSGGFDRRNLRLLVHPVATERARNEQLLSLGRTAPGAAVVYAATRGRTERLAAAYRRVGLSAAPFHAGLPTSERGRIQDRFLDNRIRIIVATNAFGMGVDKPDVRLVVHAEPPLTLEAYYQEAGRAGRDGHMASCVLLLGPHDLSQARSRIASATVTPHLVMRLAQLLGSDARPASPAGLGEQRGALDDMARRLAASTRDVGAALRLLTEAGVVAPAQGTGILRILALAERVSSDRSIASDDAAALQLLMSEAVRAAAGASPIRTSALASVAPSGDVRGFLRRLEAAQLAVWHPVEAPWVLRTVPPPALCDLLASRHATRVARDLWRHRQVARLVCSSRCRRLVLLRYFGDAAPTGPCDACDICEATR